jgi:SAM-dependent methyltransferase
MMCHALEHVPSPMATLKAVRPLLGPGGRLVVVCPLIDSLASQWLGAAWFGIDVPRHLTHFTQVTLRRHLEAAGFVVERAQPIRRPVWLRRSFEYLADDTGRAIHRRLAKSRLVARLASHWELLLGRTDEVLFVARRS